METTLIKNAGHSTTNAEGKAFFFGSNAGSNGCAVGRVTRDCRTSTKGDHTMIIYGLNTCPLCKKAVKALETVGKTFTFRDVRADPLSEEELAELIAEFGDLLVDRKSNDYRALNDWLKNSEAEAQLAARPKLMARPVIRDGDTYYLGWDDAVQKALLAD
jgi:arsenate reductase